MRVLVGGIGYRNLRDHSLGVAVTDALEAEAWPDGVAVEDVSYNPIALVQRLEDERALGGLERVVLVAAVPRPGRPPGTIEAYRWDRALPDAERIQAAVAEAVTGVISLDNTLVVAEQFQAWPSDVLVVELEPQDHEFGSELSAAAARAFPELCAIVRALATDEGTARRLPETPLGGGRRAPTRVA